MKIANERHKQILRENIFSIENFLSTEDCLELSNFCKTRDYWPNDFYKRGEVAKDDPSKRPQHQLVNKYIEIGLNEVSYHFGREMKLLYPAVLRQYKSGSNLEIHSDGAPLNPETNEVDYLRDYDPLHEHPVTLTEGALVIYINDDYEGGEIFFPDLDLEIKPKAGQLISWPSGPMFEHGVKHISGGNRYVISSFLTNPKLTLLHQKIRQTYSTQ